MNNEVLKGPGGAPCRASSLPITAKERKEYPVASGVLDYFPDAIAAVAHVSYVGNEQHNPGLPLRWDRSKSGDEADTLQRHFLERGTFDKDGLRHSAKMTWRALALLQKEIEAERAVVSSGAVQTAGNTLEDAAADSGYRRLKTGETIQDGDEYWQDWDENKSPRWVTQTHVTGVALKKTDEPYKWRRKIEPAYRPLQLGEIIQEGDEFFDDTGIKPAWFPFAGSVGQPYRPNMQRYISDGRTLRPAPQR